MKITLLILGFFTIYFVQTPNMTGKWIGFLKIPTGDSIKMIYNFQVKGEKLFGSMQGPEGTGSIEDGKIKDSLFSFIIQGTKTASNSGKYYGDSIGDDISLTGGMKFHVTLRRTE
jgi:hypothetical protein